MILVSISRLVDPLILAHIIDKIIPSKNSFELLKFSSFFVLVVIVSGILTYLQNIIFAKLGLNLITKLKMDLFSHMLQLPISYFDQRKVGELLARVESDGERVKELFSNQTVMIFGNIIFFLGMLIILLLKNWFVTLILLLPLFFILFISLLIIRYLTKYYKRIREVYAQLLASLTEYIQGIMVIQLFNRTEKINKKVFKKSEEKFRIEAKTSFIEYSFWSIQTFFVETLFIIIVILLISPKIFSGLLTVGTLVIFIQYGLRLFQPVMQISENFNMFQKGYVSLQRILNIMSLKRENTGENKKILKDFKESIIFEDVKFSYKYGEEVLKGINLKIRKGEKVAFVGRSGSGKTTTANLLLGFYTGYDGKILIDGVELKEYDLKSVRKIFAYIPQDMIIFPGDILENVRLYDETIEEEKVREALKNVAGEKLLDSEYDIYREIKENGQNISSGEKQLINLARILVFSNTQIILMDEATSSIDEKTEKFLILKLDELLKGKTSIIIAHRLSTVMNSDKIYLFKDGKIVASGKHEELVKKSKDYTDLVNLNFLEE